MKISTFGKGGAKYYHPPLEKVEPNIHLSQVMRKDGL
jgi:hypothetical protein